MLSAGAERDGSSRGSWDGDRVIVGMGQSARHQLCPKKPSRGERALFAFWVYFQHSRSRRKANPVITSKFNRNDNMERKV